jgi:hypothetical protein
VAKLDCSGLLFSFAYAGHTIREQDFICELGAMFGAVWCSALLQASTYLKLKRPPEGGPYETVFANLKEVQPWAKE